MDVNGKTGLITTIQGLSADSTCNTFGTSASNFDADALRIGLATILIIRTLSDSI